MPIQDPVFPIVDGKYKMDQEPNVRIGVVLSQDGKKELRLRLARCQHRLVVDGEAIAIDPNGHAGWVVRVAGDRVEAHGSVKAPAGRVVRFEPVEPSEPTTGSGTLVHDVVSGRGFHWNKEIDQTLTGTLEFTVEDGRLVVVNELPIEEYLIGVVTGEMSGDCPPEFLKAQCVAARSWLLAQPRSPHPGKAFIWCNDDCCQRYQGTGGWTEAARRSVQSTRGEVLITASNRYCDARYSKNTGGISEDAHAVWAEEMEGLEAVVDAPADSAVHGFFPLTDELMEDYVRGAWLADTDAYAGPHAVPEDSQSRYLGRVDEQGTYFRWSVSLSQDDLAQALRTRGGAKDLAEVLRIVPGKRGRSGRLLDLDVHYRDAAGTEKTHRLISEYRIREGLWMKFLYSSAFIVEENRSGDGRLAGVTLHGAGWGHGAGLCQMGALGRALQGQDYRTILMAYYTRVRLEKIYP